MSQSHLAARLSEKHRDAFRKFEVPEWADDAQPFYIYHTPMTLADLKKIRARADGDETETLAYTVMFKALDSHGEPLFGLQDKLFLMAGGASIVISRIVMELNKTQGFDEIKKA